MLNISRKTAAGVLTWFNLCKILHKFRIRPLAAAMAEYRAHAVCGIREDLGCTRSIGFCVVFGIGEAELQALDLVWNEC